MHRALLLLAGLVAASGLALDERAYLENPVDAVLEGDAAAALARVAAAAPRAAPRAHSPPAAPRGAAVAGEPAPRVR